MRPYSTRLCNANQSLVKGYNWISSLRLFAYFLNFYHRNYHWITKLKFKARYTVKLHENSMAVCFSNWLFSWQIFRIRIDHCVFKQQVKPQTLQVIFFFKYISVKNKKRLSYIHHCVIHYKLCIYNDLEREKKKLTQFLTIPLKFMQIIFIYLYIRKSFDLA